MSISFDNLPLQVKYKGEFYEIGTTVNGAWLAFGGGNKPELEARLYEAQEAAKQDPQPQVPTTPA
jgi:hypothetical protein